jgi:hypothetical protein
MERTVRLGAFQAPDVFLDMAIGAMSVRTSASSPAASRRPDDLLAPGLTDHGLDKHWALLVVDE